MADTSISQPKGLSRRDNDSSSQSDFSLSSAASRPLRLGCRASAARGHEAAEPDTLPACSSACSSACSPTAVACCLSPVPYPQLAAEELGETHAHRLSWAHAVNSKLRLEQALRSGVNFLEADVTIGRLRPSMCELSTAWREGKNCPLPPHAARAVEATGDLVHIGKDLIMAHWPAEHGDLSLAECIEVIVAHNERARQEGVAPSLQTAAVPSARSPLAGFSALSRPEEPSSSAGRTSACSCSRGPRSDGAEEQPQPAAPAASSKGPLLQAPSSPASLSCDESCVFVTDLIKELDRQSGPLSAACFGARRGDCRPALWTTKGIKLDFKSNEAVEPSLRVLKELRASSRLRGHLWLNADVFEGPGALTSPLDPLRFVRLCAQLLPDAVLSLGWGSSIVTTRRLYTAEMVDRMVELCMSPIIHQDHGRQQGHQGHQGHQGPGPFPGPFPGQPEEEWALAPAAVCRHITFAVNAGCTLQSSENLRRLLDLVPGSSLTIFTSHSPGLVAEDIRDLIRTFGDKRCFLDIRVKKSWRSCAQACTVA